MSDSKQLNLIELSAKFASKLAKIKVALFDVDGVLTNGLIIWHGEEVGFNRSTHALDGYGFQMLMKAGIKVGIVSGGGSLSLKKRFKENLGLDYIFIGNEDKRDAWIKVKEDGYKDEEMLYMGDELFDIPLLKKAGFAATVPHAGLEVREVVDYITQRKAGEGCAREVIDLLRYVQGINPKIPDFNE